MAIRWHTLTHTPHRVIHGSTNASTQSGWFFNFDVNFIYFNLFVNNVLQFTVCRAFVTWRTTTMHARFICLSKASGRAHEWLMSQKPHFRVTKFSIKKSLRPLGMGYVLCEWHGMHSLSSIHYLSILYPFPCVCVIWLECKHRRMRTDRMRIERRAGLVVMKRLNDANYSHKRCEQFSKTIAETHPAIWEHKVLAQLFIEQ